MRNILTARENEICQHLIKGKSNKQIAFDLGISIATLKKHLNNAFHATNTYNRIGLVMYYLKVKGLLKDDKNN